MEQFSEYIRKVLEIKDRRITVLEQKLEDYELFVGILKELPEEFWETAPPEVREKLETLLARPVGRNRNVATS